MYRPDENISKTIVRQSLRLLLFIMGIFGRIRERKDPGVLKELNRYLSFHTRLAVTNTSIKFFEDCIRNSRYPVKFCKQLRRSRIRPDGVALKRHTLNCLDTLRTQADEFRRLLAVLQVADLELTEDEREEFMSYVENITNKQVMKKMADLHKSLTQVKPQSTFPSNPERYVHNLSVATLDDTLLEVLSLGPKFCCPHGRHTDIAIETQFENVYSQTTDLSPVSSASLDHFKSELVNCSYQYTNVRTYQKSPLTREHLDALKNLRTRTDVLITKPDKGSGVVLLNKQDYLEKMSHILSDPTKFGETSNEKDQTNIVEDQLTSCLKRMKDQDVISAGTYEKLRPVGTAIPRLYGLPKIHKPNVPMRPILDMCNSPYHDVAKWLADMLEPLRRHLCQYSLHDSFEFVDLVRDLNLNSKRMISFDVTSLFTNVPLIETINFICDYIESSNFTVPLPTQYLRELLLRCTFNIQFQFNGSLYRQLDGVAMGSPLGPLLSDIFMSSLELGILRDAIDSFCFYRRYVDDIFIILDDQADLTPLLDIFNCAHHSIQFTAELEQDSSFNFLDVKLSKRPDGSLKRSVHRKSTWTGQYTNFHSFVPLRQKRTLVQTLAHRARRICSLDALDDELSLIARVLEENGYPERFVVRNMAVRRAHDVVLKAERKPIFLSLPFKGDQAADSLNRRLHKSLQRTFPAATLKSWFVTRPLLRMSLKDKLPVHGQNMVVYSFICSCTAEYVGRTTRQLKSRMKEHLPAWLRTGEPKSIRSSIVSHLVDTGHVIDPTSAFSIIFQAPRNLPRSIRSRYITTAEAVAIRQRNPALCNQKRFVQALRLPWPSNHERPTDMGRLPIQSGPIILRESEGRVNGPDQSTTQLIPTTDCCLIGFGT